ncbi:SCO3242 family prenyltransferase [Streptomyces sp. NPDC050439]|uniref:SCO3242 family prenyltransferase n=1 Tax=unclassified Streptomyces TaxID=2593676 RepID=UPI00342076C8
MKGAGAERAGAEGAGAEGAGSVGAGGGFGGGTGGGASLGSGRDWAELLRVSALFTVPGDALAGAAATGLNPNRRTLLAIAASLSLYEAGMALNDWADREEDAVERPHRPLPSGRIAPPVALGAAAALTAGGLALAAAAGRPALTVAGALAATVWSYDLGLKHTPAGPAAMAAARSLDLLLGAAATSAGAANAGPRGRGPRPGLRAAAPSALVLGAHTLAVTAVSRREAQGGSTAAPLAALAATAALTRLLTTGSAASNNATPANTATNAAPANADAGMNVGPANGETGTNVGPATADAGMNVAPATAVTGMNVGSANTVAGTSADAGTSQLPADRGGTATRGLPGFTPSEPSRGRPKRQALGQVVGRAWRAGGVTGGVTGGAWRAGSGGAVRALGEPSRGRPKGQALGQVVGRAWRTGDATGPLPGRPGSAWRIGARAGVQLALAATYAATAARPLFHAALNPSPQLTQRAVGGGIRAMIPLQAALSARTGALGPALLTAALAPAARKFGRKVSVT